MKQKIRVLWIEDGARFDMAQLAAPVIMDGSYDLVVAENASEGIAQLLSSIFDVIIVDIRLPPGDDEEWIKLYQKMRRDKIFARLGRHLLFTILGHPQAAIKLGDKRPEWITRERIGILSVESWPELKEDLGILGIRVYHQKQSETPDTILLGLITKVLKLIDCKKESLQ